MTIKEIITYINNQLEDGYIDLNDTDDIEEMNYIRKTFYKLRIYSEALDKACAILTNLSGDCWYCPLNSERQNKCLCEHYDCNEEQWKKYLLKESEKQ